ncbi:hypothetical protein [Catenovulum sediminis]|uniref:hypothetical protein n=1 Tax=Catenovulum sediminis TaxID=1740262 RepID=UPI00117FB567|nr:hypothetical protein [Catenovulum sediminis]
MPIAHCLIAPALQKKVDNTTDLINLWVLHSGIPQAESEMTVNITHSNIQIGKGYAVMASLLLPSLWSKENISALQLGLASALSDYYSLPSKQVFVTTSIIESGLVVENNQEVKW